MRRTSIVLLAVALAAASVWAQAPKPQTPAPQAGAPAERPSPAGRGAAPPPIEPPGFTYHAEGRRDPFVSLLRRGAGTRGATAAGARPAGLGGRGRGITLRGTVRSREAS
jgi:hypothetical protein